MERTSSGVDSRPLLGNNNVTRRANIQEAARFIRRAGSRRIMGERSALVRETAAEQLEERQSDWAHSKPVVLLDVVWNLAFVLVSIVVLASSYKEKPRTPLRVWIAGYALQCFLHMLYVGWEYRKRNRERSRSGRGSGNSEVGVQVEPRSNGDREEEEVQESWPPEERSSIAKRLESVNTMFSFIWWIVGFYWIIAGGQSLPQYAPKLYWLCIVFLAFDVFFVVFCVSLACVIGIAVCCCLPCILAILYTLGDQEGASEADISFLPKYKFCRFGPSEKSNGEKSRLYGGIMTSTGGDPSMNRVLSAEDAECSICLSAYDEGVELLDLPCSHHFHCACIEKWLRINATCPLCKYNILKSSSDAIQDV